MYAERFKCNVCWVLINVCMLDFECSWYSVFVKCDFRTWCLNEIVECDFDILCIAITGRQQRLSDQVQFDVNFFGFCSVGPEFQNHGFVYKNFLTFLLTSFQRQKYYFAWKLGMKLAYLILSFKEGVGWFLLAHTWIWELSML